MSGDRYTLSDKEGSYFLTFTVVDWLDPLTGARVPPRWTGASVRRGPGCVRGGRPLVPIVTAHAVIIRSRSGARGCSRSALSGALACGSGVVHSLGPPALLRIPGSRGSKHGQVDRPVPRTLRLGRHSAIHELLSSCTRFRTGNNGSGTPCMEQRARTPDPAARRSM